MSPAAMRAQGSSRAQVLARASPAHSVEAFAKVRVVASQDQATADTADLLASSDEDFGNEVKLEGHTAHTA